MQHLRRLTLFDIGLIVALIVTGVLWALSRSDAPPDADEIIANLDLAAWDETTDLMVDALLAGNLRGVQSALESGADLAEAAGDRTGAGGLRRFSSSLTRVDLASIELGLARLDPFPDSPLFANLYIALWAPLFAPPIPRASPEAGAEWSQINAVAPETPTEQYWGTAVWYLPESVADSAGEADIDIPGLGLTAKLMFAIDGDDIQMTLVFIGPLDDAEITGAVGFWVTTGADQTLLTGNALTLSEGLVQLRLAPGARDDNVAALLAADEIGLAINFTGDRQYFLRIEVGESGRALLGRTLGG